MLKFAKNEITGWDITEVVRFAVACAVIAGLSVYWGDSMMGIISSVTGVACVVCTGMTLHVSKCVMFGLV